MLSVATAEAPRWSHLEGEETTAADLATAKHVHENRSREKADRDTKRDTEELLASLEPIGDVAAVQRKPGRRGGAVGRGRVEQRSAVTTLSLIHI